MTEYHWPAVPGLSIPGRPGSTIVAATLTGDCRDSFADYRLRPICRRPAAQRAAGRRHGKSGRAATRRHRVVRPAELAGLDKSQASRAVKAVETAGAVRHDPQTLESRLGWRLPSLMLATKSTRVLQFARTRCGRFHPGIPKLQSTFASAAMTGFMHGTVWWQAGALKTFMERERIALLPDIGSDALSFPIWTSINCGRNTRMGAGCLSVPAAIRAAGQLAAALKEVAHGWVRGDRQRA